MARDAIQVTLFWRNLRGGNRGSFFRGGLVGLEKARRRKQGWKKRFNSQFSG